MPIYNLTSLPTSLKPHAIGHLFKINHYPEHTWELRGKHNGVCMLRETTTHETLIVKTR